jgi:hypothetical protein
MKKKKKLPIAVQALFRSEATGTSSHTERTESDSDCLISLDPTLTNYFANNICKGNLHGKQKSGFSE